MAIVKWSPWRELDSMERRMRRMFDDVGFVAAPVPAADVYETDGEFVVEIEVPGYDEAELDVEVSGRVLVITGQGTEDVEEKDKTFHRRERLEVSFERRFTLPADVDPDTVRATFDKGVLSVHAQKVAESEARRVEITT